MREKRTEPGIEFLKPSSQGIEVLGLLLLLALMAFTILSCQKPAQFSEKKVVYNENVLRIDVGEPFGSLDPLAGDDMLGSHFIAPLLYSYLFVPNEEGLLDPDLAIGWSYDPKTFTWTIRLRRDAYFHNRKQVTANDVEYSLARFSQGYSGGFLSLIDRMVVSSETTLDIILKKDDPDYLYKIWAVEIISKPQEAIGNTNAYEQSVGSGPFKFLYRDGEKEIGLTANIDYFHGRPSLDRIIFYSFPDRERSWARLLSGKTDIAPLIYPRDYEMIEPYAGSFCFNTAVRSYYTLLLFNTNDPLFVDSNVRLALSYAVDKNYIVNKILRGAGIVAAGPMGLFSVYHNPDVIPVPFNPAKALQLLHEAGWSYDENGRSLQKNGKCFEFTLFVFDGDQVYRRIAEYLQLSFNEIGIKAHIQSLPLDVFFRKYHGSRQFQAVLTEFRDACNVPEMLHTVWTPALECGSLAGCFEHPDVTSLFQQALQEKNLPVRKDLFFRIDHLLNSLQPGVFLFHRKVLDAMSRRIKVPYGFSLRNAGIYRLRHASVAVR